MAASQMSFACLLSMLPGPPSIQWQDAVLQAYPVSKFKCPYVNPKRDIQFELYTRINPLVSQPLAIGDDALLRASNLDFRRPTVVYFHAFLENSDAGSAALLRQALLLRGEANIIFINAERLVAGPWYFTSVDNTLVVGMYAARLIDYLVTRGLNLRTLHLIGHSLGAQMAGVCGHYMKSGKPSRITGLDPALPMYNKLPLSRQLDKSDADFVDIIHTDSGIFGIAKPMGHVDFYPNGGQSPQPGCELEVIIPRAQIVEQVFCSHWKSYQYFAESVLKPQGFLAAQCPSWKHFKKGQCSGRREHMGYGVSTHMIIMRGKRVLYAKLEKELLAAFKGDRMSNEIDGGGGGLATDKEREKLTAARAGSSREVKKRSKRGLLGQFPFSLLGGGRRTILPIIAVMRESNTKIQSLTGHLDHFQRERNTFIGSDSIADKLTPFGIGISLTRDSANAMPGLMARLLGFFRKGNPVVPGGFNIMTSYDPPK